MTFEGYRITLEHFYVTDDQKKSPIDLPVVVQVVYDRTFSCTPIVINEMIRRMEHELLVRMKESEE